VGKYKSVKTIVDLLVDIVSRNGNLMLNFPLPASGMLDSDELGILDGITKWMAMNSEGIYDTKPWKKFGETAAAAAKKEEGERPSFNEEGRKDLGASDVRFTTKGNVLYAFVMGKPTDNLARVKSLSSGSGYKIDAVELLGTGKVDFEATSDELVIKLPGSYPGEHALAFKIRGAGIV
jgi:alpha-L-fucosidase